ncbi:hypothetical protein BH11PSE11_BH11PSE11_16480 [soil metagenome]
MAISSPGIGSNLDVNGIVTKLMQVESQPLTALQKKEASYQAKLSAYGTIKGALGTFQTAVAGLNDITKFQTLNASSSDSTVLSATASSVASAGTYGITVTNLAQAQALSSGGQANTTSAIGAGTSTTLSFQFGTISGGVLASGQYTGASFTQDASQASGTVVIDSSNNSLQGIRDAINAAKVGVTASIVNDGSVGSPYHLMLTSNSTGVSKSMKISSSGGDASITSLLAYDPAATQNLTQTIVAQNASLSVNGLAISSASNAVTGAIAGVTLNLTKGLGATTTVNVANNASAVVTAVQSFVTAYNSANTTIKSLTGYNASTKVAGLLLGDTATQQIQASMRSTIATTLAGLGSNTLTNLTQVGITFLKDGSLTLDNAKLTSALGSNFSDFAQLFAAIGKPTDSLINYASSSVNSKPGSYAVSVTTLAKQATTVGSNKGTQANLAGSIAADLNIVAASNDKLLVQVDGGLAVSVTLTPGAPYASAAALATQVQTDINAALTLAGQSSQVSVTQSGGKLSINSTTFGSTSAISVTDDPGFPTNTGAASLLGTPTSSSISTITAGVNDKLNMTVNGTAGVVTLAAGTYTAATMAAQLQSAINGTAAFSAASQTVNVTQSADVFTITSDRYGSTSAVSLTGGTAMINLFGLAPSTTLGNNVAGTINGVAATGLGQNLTGATGDASEGIRLQVVGGATGARGTVNYSQGYAYKMNAVLTNFLASSGSIASSTDSANRSITDLQKQAETLTARLTLVEKRYRKQFSALDSLIGQMSVTSNFLNQQLANLPKIS